MATFSVPVTIGVDEDKIAREIESEVKEKVIRNIGDKVEGIIYRKEKSYNYGKMKIIQNDAPLRGMIVAQVHDILEDKKDLIIQIAAKELADKLSRQKAVREIAASVAEDIYGK